MSQGFPCAIGNSLSVNVPVLGEWPCMVGLIKQADAVSKHLHGSPCHIICICRRLLWVTRTTRRIRYGISSLRKHESYSGKRCSHGFRHPQQGVSRTKRETQVAPQDPNRGATHARNPGVLRLQHSRAQLACVTSYITFMADQDVSVPGDGRCGRSLSLPNTSCHVHQQLLLKGIICRTKSLLTGVLCDISEYQKYFK